MVLGKGCQPEARSTTGGNVGTGLYGDRRPRQNDAPEPVGYYALISDPDDHTLEVSHGQEVALTVERADDTDR